LCGYDVVDLDKREMSCNMFSVWPLADGRSYYKSEATSVTARTVGLSTYGGMPKPGSTYRRSGNLAETTLAETETRQKVILEAVSVP